MVDDYLGDSFLTEKLYKGQYELRYTVAGQNYFVYTTATYPDRDKILIQDRVAVLPKDCQYRVRYNPKNPSEALAIPKSQTTE